MLPDLADYLPVDGSRPMTGDLDLVGNDLLFENMRLTEINTYTLALYTRTGTTKQSFKCASVYFGSLYGDTATAYIQPRSYAANEIIFRSRKTDSPAAWVEQIVLTNHATLPVCDIPHAGTFTFNDGEVIETEHKTNAELLFKGYIGSTGYEVAKIINNTLKIEKSGDILPATHASYDIGSSSLKYSNMFADNYLWGRKLHLTEQDVYGSPNEGDVRYYDGKLYYYDSADWQEIAVV